jgi:predicted NACHT family NTPase
LGREKYADFILNSVGIFPLFATTRSVQIDDIYIRVAVSTDIEREKYKEPHIIQQSILDQKKGQTRVAGEPTSVIHAVSKSNRCFALLGTAGSGKTTSYRYLAVQLARGEKINGESKIPIYFAIRDLKTRFVSIEQAAISLFEKMGFSLSDRVVISLMKSGRIVLILDGLDETDEDHQQEILHEIEEVRTKYPGTILCISGRPYSLSIGMPGFRKWEVLSLSYEQRINFVNK